MSAKVLNQLEFRRGRRNQKTFASIIFKFYPETQELGIWKRGEEFKLTREESYQLAGWMASLPIPFVMWDGKD